MKVKKGNIFTSDCQTLVNTVNCVGVMGAGIALEFKFRYPLMFERYQELCEQRLIDIGKLWLYKPPEGDRWILNFPTKKDWKMPSRPEYLHKGLQRFIATYKEKAIESIAFPVLGASHGGLDEDVALAIMSEYLMACEILVEVYRYDKNATDDLFLRFKEAFSAASDSELAEALKLRRDLIAKIRHALELPHINSISRLATERGIGLVSLEKSFRYLMDSDKKLGPPDQQALF